MEISKTFKKMMIDKDIKQIAIADNLGLAKQNFSNQLKADNFRIRDIVKIADILGYETKLQFIDKESGKVVDA